MGYGNGGEVGGGYSNTGMDARKLAAQTSAPQRPALITSQTEDLARQIESLQQNVATLEKRLELVLQPSAPQPTESSDKASPLAVPYARALNALSDQVRGVNQRLGDILQRIEL